MFVISVTKGFRLQQVDTQKIESFNTAQESWLTNGLPNPEIIFLFFPSLPWKLYFLIQNFRISKINCSELPALKSQMNKYTLPCDIMVQNLWEDQKFITR